MGYTNYERVETIRSSRGGFGQGPADAGVRLNMKVAGRNSGGFDGKEAGFVFSDWPELVAKDKPEKCLISQTGKRKIPSIDVV